MRDSHPTAKAVAQRIKSGMGSKSSGPKSSSKSGMGRSKSPSCERLVGFEHTAADGVVRKSYLWLVGSPFTRPESSEAMVSRGPPLVVLHVHLILRLHLSVHTVPAHAFPHQHSMLCLHGHAHVVVNFVNDVVWPLHRVQSRLPGVQLSGIATQALSFEQ